MSLDQILHPLPRVETALHGPAHPEEFRTKVGQWGQRWYTDNLPACALAPASDDVWPSVTTIKKAADRDWTWVSLERAATYLHDRRNELDGLNAVEIHKRLLEVNKAGLGRAAGRGTSIHHVMEALAAGATSLPQITPEAEQYVPACRAWLDKHQPEWLLSEFVVINRTVGYGGTGDAVVVLDGTPTIVDWKSRKSAEKHGAYPEEAWQLAAYRNAQYMIVDQGGDAARRPLPDIDQALIVSIAPEGCRAYPVDLDEAWAAFQSLRQFWADKQRKVIGRAVRLNRHHKRAQVSPDDGLVSWCDKCGQRLAGLAPHSYGILPCGCDSETIPQPIGPTAQLVAYRAWILHRAETIKANPAAVKALPAHWPTGVPGLRTEHPHTETELEAISDALSAVETEFSMPFTTPDPRAPKYEPKPEPEPVANDGVDEGGVAPGNDVLDMLNRIDALPATTRMALNGWAAEAHAEKLGFSLRAQPTQRRLAIYKALLALLPFIDDTDVLWACLDHAIGIEKLRRVHPTGALMGSLTLDQATRLEETAAQLTNGELTLHFHEDITETVERGSAYLTPTSESEQR